MFFGASRLASFGKEWPMFAVSCQSVQRVRVVAEASVAEASVAEASVAEASVAGCPLRRARGPGHDVSVSRPPGGPAALAWAWALAFACAAALACGCAAAWG